MWLTVPVDQLSGFQLPDRGGPDAYFMVIQGMIVKLISTGVFCISALGV